MPDDRPEKPSRTVWFETGMAMTMSCSPSRETVCATAKAGAGE